MDLQQLRAQCERTLERTDFSELGPRIEGKVRDCYVHEGRRILVATDRVSAFDVVLGTIPWKGQVLNQLAAFWLERTAALAPNHLIEVPDPNVTLALDCRPLPVEFVVRGYLTGGSPTSIWTAYRAGARRYCGHELPEGLRKHEPLPRPLLTPTTKAERGAHDELTSREEVLARGWVEAALYDRAEALVMSLFEEGTRFAEKQGLVLADTKYELGLDQAGELRVIDEVHTPDSSRYWYRESYEQAMKEGGDPRSLDKEYVRDWVSTEGWRGEGVHPELPVEVRCEAARRYIETFERVTGQAFRPDLEDPDRRMRRNLRLPEAR
ncbi:MAG: phosphoribosylaminoimidazolesuccinocarboxamide synthase [Myxococcota bacterium]